jgi:hypothetical protein
LRKPLRLVITVSAAGTSVAGLSETGFPIVCSR